MINNSNHVWTAQLWQSVVTTNPLAFSELAYTQLSVVAEVCPRSNVLVYRLGLVREQHRSAARSHGDLATFTCHFIARSRMLIPNIIDFRNSYYY